MNGGNAMVKIKDVAAKAGVSVKMYRSWRPEPLPQGFRSWWVPILFLTKPRDSTARPGLETVWYCSEPFPAGRRLLNAF